MATTQIYTLSLHDALPISGRDEPHRYHEEHSGKPPLGQPDFLRRRVDRSGPVMTTGARDDGDRDRSEEHTSELQSQSNLVCRLLLEKKKNIRYTTQSASCN